MTTQFDTMRADAVAKAQAILVLAQELVKSEALSADEQDRLFCSISSASYVARDNPTQAKRARFAWEQKINKELREGEVL